MSSWRARGRRSTLDPTSKEPQRGRGTTDDRQVPQRLSYKAVAAESFERLTGGNANRLDSESSERARPIES